MVGRFAILITLFLSAPLANAGDSVADEDKNWFVNQYVPLWISIESVDPIKIQEYWIEGFRDHPIDLESRAVENSAEQWQRTIERYRDEGMQESIFLDAQAERINDFTVLLSARWKDDPPVSPDEPFFCDMYLVGKFEDSWKITNYFTVDCPVE